MQIITFQLALVAAALNVKNCESDANIITELQAGVRSLVRKASIFIDNSGMFVNMVNDVMVSLDAANLKSLVEIASSRKDDIIEALRTSNITVRETASGLEYSLPAVIDGEYSVIATDK